MEAAANGEASGMDVVYTTVDALRPQMEGVNIICKCLGVTVIMNRRRPDGSFTKISEAKVRYFFVFVPIHYLCVHLCVYVHVCAHTSQSQMIMTFFHVPLSDKNAECVCVHPTPSHLSCACSSFVSSQVGDATGTVLLTLRGEQVDQVKTGSVLTIVNGKVEMFKATMRLAADVKLGKIEVAEDGFKPKWEVNVRTMMTSLLSASHHSRSSPHMRH